MDTFAGYLVEDFGTSMTFWWLFCFRNKPKESCDAEAQTGYCNEEEKEVQVDQPTKYPGIIGSKIFL